MSSSAPSPEALARRHREMLVLACIVLVLAFVLEVGNGDRVNVVGSPRLALPPLCQSYAWFGVRCPGCGLTRSLVHFAHGNWYESWRHHRLGWLMALAIVIQIPYRLLALRRADRALLGGAAARLFAYLLIVLLIGNWLLDMVVL